MPGAEGAGTDREVSSTNISKLTVEMRTPLSCRPGGGNQCLDSGTTRAHSHEG